MSTPRLVFFPGMGADERLFEPQRAWGLKLEVPAMPIPERGDTLSRYARRLVDTLSLDSDCIIGGVSFGGMLACEVAAVCNPRCTLLVASCRGRRAIRRSYWPAEWVSRLLPDRVLRRRCIASSRLLAKMEDLTHEQYRLVRDMSVDVPVLYLRRVGRMVLYWRRPSPLACPVYHIHGASDRIIPLRKVRPDEVISDGGHLINLTHPEQVNRFIERKLAGP